MHVTSPPRGARRRHAALGGGLAVMVAVMLSSGAVVGGRLDRLDLRASGFDSTHLSGALVKVESARMTATGAGSQQAGWGVIIDPSGLVLVNAHVAAPDAPGLAARYWSPTLTASVTQTVISVSPGAAQPPAPAYTATVVAADGYLDVAVLRIDATYPDGAPLPPGASTFPAIGLGDTSAVGVGTGVTFATYAEASASSVLGDVEAGYTELAGSVTATEVDPRIGTAITTGFQTDIISPTSVSGGVAVDASGLLVGLPRWFPGTAESRVDIVPGSLIRPLVDAAAAGTLYSSPYTVLGTGSEQLALDSWAPSLVSACADPRPAPMSVYPPGASEIAAAFSYDGFTDGEDVLILWYDPVQQTLITADLAQWQGGPTGACTQFGISRSDGQPLADGDYGLQVSVGSTLSISASGQTTVGQAAAGTIQVSGRIIDADTGQPLAGASVFVLDQGVDPSAWFTAPTDEQVAASASTSSDGTYATSPPLVAGVYPFIVSALGYRPVGGTVDITEGGILSDISLVSSE